MRTKIFFILLILSLHISGVYSQDMKPPAPVENKTFDMSIGEWVSDPYEMMGMKWTSKVSHKWVHNHQFMDLFVTSTADNGTTYTASGYFTCDKDGNLTGWMFDDWGAAGVSTITGKAEGNKVTMAGKYSGGTWTREGVFESDGVVKAKWSWVMKGPDGKDMTISGEQTFRKK